MQKKITAMAITASLIFSLAACGRAAETYGVIEANEAGETIDIAEQDNAAMGESEHSEPDAAKATEATAESESKDIAYDNRDIVGSLEWMDYTLFLETNAGYGASENYLRYGIYGDFTKTSKEGEQVYFELCKKLLGEEISFATMDEWYDNTDLHIQNLSPDLQWAVAREYYDEAGRPYEDTLFHNGELVSKEQSSRIYLRTLCHFTKTGQGDYSLLLDTDLFEWRQELVDDMWNGLGYIWMVMNATCYDGSGKLMAAAEADNQTIRIYRLKDKAMLHRITLDTLDADWPIEVSQIEGDEEQGWIVFSNGDVTYRMSYPDGSLEKIGEYMYGTVYSPDERYRAYCTGNEILDDLGLDFIDEGNDEKIEKYNAFYDKWEQIPDGWYVEELDTGRKAYIPIETYRDNVPLYGGRCVWLEKEKLLNMLDEKE